MKVCPHCGADFERDGMYCWFDADVLYAYYPNRDADNRYEEQDMQKGKEPYKWECPECQKAIDYIPEEVSA